jgi:hypothetical protein
MRARLPRCKAFRSSPCLSATNVGEMDRRCLVDAPAEGVMAEHFRPTLILPKPPKAIGDVLLSANEAQIGCECAAPLEVFL